MARTVRSVARPSSTRAAIMAPGPATGSGLGGSLIGADAIATPWCWHRAHLGGVRSAGTWLVAVLCIAAGSVGGEAAGIPGAALLAGLVVGVVAAVRGRERLTLGRPPFAAAQAVIGVVLGTYLRPSTLDALGSHWLPVLAVSAATPALTIGAGVLLARATGGDAPTAALGMVAGGANGILAMSNVLGADDRLAAGTHVLRVRASR